METAMLLVICGAFCLLAGCDLGTYNQRFEERLKKTQTGGSLSSLVQSNDQSSPAL
jgi:hypothetical protein